MRRLAVALILSATAAVGPVATSEASERPETAPAAAQALLASVPASLVKAVQLTLLSYGYAVAVDGIVGPQTTKAVLHWQKVNGLYVDGIIGPQVLSSMNIGAVVEAPAVRVDPPVSGAGPDTARAALIAAGANQSEVEFGLRICERESHCTLGAVNQNSRTGDNSWGPWQINFFGGLMQSRAALLGPPSSNIESWERAAANFLKLLRTSGRCHWEPPSYCSGG